MQSELQTDAILSTEQKISHVLETSHHWLEKLLTLGCLIQAITKFSHLHLFLFAQRGKACSKELGMRESMHLGEESPEDHPAGG